MTDLVPPHAHCKTCGKAIPEDSVTCSKACATKREEKLKSQRLNTYLFFGVAIFLVFLLIYSYH